MNPAQDWGVTNNVTIDFIAFIRPYETLRTFVCAVKARCWNARMADKSVVLSVLPGNRYVVGAKRLRTLSGVSSMPLKGAVRRR